MTTVVSFYTPEWQYPEYAKKLQDDCARLGLACYIVEKPSNNDYVKNCNIKPFFIKECLEKFQDSVFWIDVDGSICSRPELLLSDSITNFDVAGNRSIRNPARIHVGSLWFNYTKSTLEFITTWCDTLTKYGIDDAVFNGIWDQFSNKIKFYELPPEYFFILSNPDTPAPENVCVAHRLSNSTLKQTYKNDCRKS